jgi:hypothetical protein
VILGVSDAQTRNLEAAGLIAPEMVVDGRFPLFSVKKAHALRERRAAARARGLRKRPDREPDPAGAA